MPATQRPVAVEVAAARWNKVAKRTPPDIISRHKELRSNEAYLPLVGPIIILCRPLWVLMIIRALPFSARLPLTVGLREMPSKELVLSCRARFAIVRKLMHIQTRRRRK